MQALPAQRGTTQGSSTSSASALTRRCCVAAAARRNHCTGRCAGLRRARTPARFYRGYYNFAVKRRSDAHEFWIRVYSLQDLELMAGYITTGRQFNSFRRRCSNYAQAAKAMFVERANRLVEIRSEELQGER